MAGTDQYGYQPSQPSALERWVEVPGQELTQIDQGSTRIRLALSTTTRGWDYESTVEITAPSHDLTPEEREALVQQAAAIQVELRKMGAEERNARNLIDQVGPHAPAKATK